MNQGVEVLEPGGLLFTDEHTEEPAALIARPASRLVPSPINQSGMFERRKSGLGPKVVALVRQLRRKRPKGGQRSLRDIAAELAQRGILNERGKPFSAASINSMPLK